MPSGGALPTCSVCLEQVAAVASPRSLLGEAEREGMDASAGAAGPGGGDVTSLSSTWLSFCSVCLHGGHLKHLQSWFAKHRKCPVPRCRCYCNSNEVPFDQ